LTGARATSTRMKGATSEREKMGVTTKCNNRVNYNKL